ncbi:MAG: hypothetical protein IPJ32_11210 [Sphingobacteriaceae bacterium]|nr:hypothetical protein [Sphingobacteriaceae bacterium]
MPRFCFIVLFIFLRLQITLAQTGYKEVDPVKYTKSEIITNVNGFKTVVFYKNDSIRKIKREFVGGSFSSTTIYYLINDKLVHNVFVSLRKPSEYYEEHMYFNNGTMYKWENTRDKEVNPFKQVFEEKKNLLLTFLKWI